MIVFSFLLLYSKGQRWWIRSRPCMASRSREDQVARPQRGSWTSRTATDQLRRTHQVSDEESTSCRKSLGARQNDVNAQVVLPGTHRSAMRMRLKSWHLLQPITNLSFVCFNQWNLIPCKILSSNIISCSYIHPMLMGCSNCCSFKVHVLTARNKQSVHIVSFPAGRMFTSYLPVHMANKE